MGKSSQLSLTVDGRLAQHHIALTGQAQQAKLSFNLDGGWLGEQGWRGKLDKLLLSHALSGQWQQQQAVSLSVSSVSIKLQQALCLKRDQAQACINADWLASGTTHASIQADLPLAWLRPWLPDTINLPGNAQFTASLSRKLGQNSGQFSLILPNNVLLLTGQTGISRYAYQEVVIQGRLQGKQLDTNLTAAVSPSIKTSAQISVTLTKKPSIKAKGQITLASLALFSHTDEAVQDLVGSVDMQWQAAGKLDALALTMQVNIDQMALTLPATGVRLQFPSLTMQMQPDGQVAIKGKLLAGEGQADFVGAAKLNNLPQWQLDISLVGQQLQLANMPQAQVWLNPELRLQATPAFARLTGTLFVPKARFHPQVRSSSAIGNFSISRGMVCNY
jgi:translocation and assembly module TamB